MPPIPTKANLMAAKKSLSLAKLGYELLDRKQSIMMREMMSLVDEAAAAQDEIAKTFYEAYAALREANISCGVRNVERVAMFTPIKDDMTVLYRSLMGVELPEIHVSEDTPRLNYGMQSTTAELDAAYLMFSKLRELIVRAAQTENAVYRLAENIKTAKKRVGALHSIVIPRLEGEIKFITEALEERERDSFTSMKILKKKTE